MTISGMILGGLALALLICILDIARSLYLIRHAPKGFYDWSRA